MDTIKCDNKKSKTTKIIKKYLRPIIRIINLIHRLLQQYRLPLSMHISESSQIGLPFLATYPQNVYLEEKTRINPYAKIINYTGRFILKKYSEISYNCTIVTGNHTPTVGIPQFYLGHSHINDNEKDVIIEEDVWIGANATILSGAHIGRGAVVGANALVNKPIPPYAVVVGIPAHIIASKFTIDQIIEHEKSLYNEQERFTKEYLELLFETHYKDKRNIGVN